MKTQYSPSFGWFGIIRESNLEGGGTAKLLTHYFNPSLRGKKITSRRDRTYSKGSGPHIAMESAA
jgi:hypothetical protein